LSASLSRFGRRQVFQSFSAEGHEQSYKISLSLTRADSEQPELCDGDAAVSKALHKTRYTVTRRKKFPCEGAKTRHLAFAPRV